MSSILRHVVSSSALITLLIVQSGTVAAQSDAAILAITAMMKNGQYDASATALEAMVAARPQDVKAHSLLALVHLKRIDLDSAASQVKVLRELKAELYANRINEAIAQMATRRQVKHALLERLRQFDSKGASDLLDQANISATERRVLQIWLLAYEGEWEQARSLAPELRGKDEDAELAQRLLETLDELEQTYREHRCTIAWLTGPPETCAPTDEVLNARESARASRSNRPLLDAWLRAAVGMLSIAPFSEQTIARYVEGAAVLMSYEDFGEAIRTVTRSRPRLVLPLEWREGQDAVRKDSSGRKVLHVPVFHENWIVDLEGNKLCVESTNAPVMISKQEFLASGYYERARKKNIEAVVYTSSQRSGDCQAFAAVDKITVSDIAEMRVRSDRNWRGSFGVVWLLDVDGWPANHIATMEKVARALAELIGTRVDVSKDSGMLTLLSGVAGSIAATAAGDVELARTSQETIQRSFEIRREALAAEQRAQMWDSIAVERAAAYLQPPAFEELNVVLLGEAE